MSANTTEMRLKQIIAEHYLSVPVEKLLIGDVAEKAGISRQAFNRYYDHLKPYISGELSIDEMLKGNDEDSDTSELLHLAQKSIKEMQEQLSHIEAKHKADTDKKVNSIITTLMNNDINLFESDKTRLTIEKHALQNQRLKDQITSLQVELTNAKAETVVDHDKHTTSAEKIKIEVELKSIFKEFISSGDLDDFEDGKEDKIQRALSRVNKFTQLDDSKVVIFIERYISSFDSFVDKYLCRDDKTYIFIRLPIFTRTELRLFVKGLKFNRPITVHIQFSNSETTTKINRRFLFRNIPEMELEQADKCYIPTDSDGFNEIVIAKVDNPTEC